MKLLIDVGNSRMKWASLQDGQLRPGAPVAHGRGFDLVALDDRWRELPEPAAIHVASVLSPSRTRELTDWLHKRWAAPLIEAASQARQVGVRNGYTQPERLGVDRWLAMIGAWAHIGDAVCVVDCGSAVTVDILDRQGQHLGGVIAPGLRLMAQALSDGTDLPLVGDTATIPLGRDTESAMTAGRLQAVVGLIERLHRQAPRGARLIVTGGDAGPIAALLGEPYELIPDLVLQGLAGTLDGA